MIRPMIVGAAALFLVGCTAKTEDPSTGTPPAAAVTADAKAVLDLGKTA